MPFYYREIPDPDHPGCIKRAYFADDVVDQEDLIYKMPGGIEHYDKYKELLDVIGRGMKDTFLDNVSIKSKGHTLKPELEDTPYQDPELARIDRDSKPLDIKVVPDDPKAYDQQVHIKVEGAYQPEPCVFERMVDYSLLPTITSLDQKGLDEYKQREAALPHLTIISRGMKIKIIGDHLRIRPNSAGDHGLCMVEEVASDAPKRYRLLDFVEVNSHGVLLLSVPKDLPLGNYRLSIVSGWYDDPGINRMGESAPFALV
ncbi:MAG: hypothetical protein RIF33_06460 [Cyclobacteriaceae bacterium]